MVEGERNNTLSAHKFHLYKLGYNDNEIMEISSIINNKFIFADPVEDEEI